MSYLTAFDPACELGNVLLDEAPQLDALERAIMEQRGVSQAQASRFISQVVHQINSALFPPLSQVELVLTEGCNLGCTYCFEKDMLGPRRMPIDVALNAVDLLLDYSGGERDLHISLFGGEPTLNFKAIQAVVKHAEQQGKVRDKAIHFNMTTNGTLIDDAKAAYLKEHNIMVLLSVDGTRESNDKYRKDKKGRGTFDRVVRAIDTLKAHQGWVGVKMTVMPENTSRLYDDVLGLRRLGVNQFTFGHATGIHWPEEAIRTYTEQVGALYQWYDKASDDDLVIKDFDDFNPDVTYFGCQAGRTSFSVSVDGQISPCSKILALDNRKLLARLGDVRHGIYCIRNRERLVGCTELRSEVEKAGITDVFQGGCFAVNYERHGNLFKPDLQEHEISMRERAACGGCTKCH